MADDPATFLHHEIKFRDEVRVAPILVQHIMLRAPGTINVPEGFTGKVFDGTVIGRGFEPDGHDGVVGLYKDRGLGGVWQEERGPSSNMDVFEDEVAILRVPSSERRFFEDERGVWRVSSSKLRVVEDEKIDGLA